MWWFIFGLAAVFAVPHLQFTAVEWGACICLVLCFADSTQLIYSPRLAVVIRLLIFGTFLTMVAC